MDANNEKYAPYITEININPALSSRPIIFCIAKEQDLSIIYQNSVFETLLSWGITADRLKRDREFQKNCFDLLDSPNSTRSHFTILIGSKETQVDFYCETRRTSQSGELPEGKSDLIIAQVDCQEYQEFLRKHPSRSVALAYQFRVIDQQIDLQNAKLKELFDSMADFNELMASQQKIISILNNHWFLKSTQKFKLKYADYGIRILLVLLSALNLSSPQVIQTTKKVYSEITNIVLESQKK